jgi:hypothetical protein
MDARTVALIAGVKVGTMNSWAQRGLVRGLELGPSGRRRNIDIEIAVRIGVIAELVRFGLAADLAAAIAWQATAPFHERLVCALAPREGWGSNDDRESYPPVMVQLVPTGASVDEGLLKMLPAPPSVYIVLNVASIEERMRKAEETWAAGVR